MGQKSTVKGDTYSEWLRHHITCLYCVVELMTGSMMVHRRHLHGTDTAIDWDQLPVSQTELLPQVFEVSFPMVPDKCQYPSQGAKGFLIHGESFKKIDWYNWRDSILIMKEDSSPFTKCDHCGRQVPPWLINNWHYTT